MILPLALAAERGFMAWRRVSIVDARGRVIASSVRPAHAEVIVEAVNAVLLPAPPTSGDVDHGSSEAPRPPRG